MDKYYCYWVLVDLIQKYESLDLISEFISVVQIIVSALCVLKKKQTIVYVTII